MGTQDPLPQSCDVVVIGAGITGALVADALSAEQLSVVVLERRAPACGSTAASTSLVSYEIDLSLTELIEKRGETDAVRAYQLSVAAIGDLEQVAATLPDRCGFARRSSLYLAVRRQHAKDLEREVETRHRYGLDAEYRTKQEIENTYGFPCHGALRTTQAAVLDPVRLTRALLDRALSRGARLYAHTPARDVRQDGDVMLVATERGDIRSRWVVYAMGYEMPESLRAGMVALHSTYAIATEPVTDFGPWQDQCLVWETARPYFYMRTTEDRRIVIGGADAPFKDAAWRERLMSGRLRRLEKRLEQLLPSVRTETAFVWAGTFGETRDGLPYIGPMPGCPRALYALGYGANGITFGAIAAKLVRDICVGRANDDVMLFRLDR